jgi:acyl-CoA thioester hydrolase
MIATTVHPRFGEVDVLGHINQAVLACWFELSRNPFFEIFEPELNPAKHWNMIMAHTEYDFLEETYFPAPVELRTYIERIGTKSFTMYHEAWQEGRLCVTGRAIIVHYDYAKKKSVPLPDDIKSRLAEHLLPEKR